MRLVHLLVCLALPALALLCAASAAGCQSPEVKNQQEAPALHRLFSFGLYKELFRKHYKSLSEETSRWRLFFARALRAFVTGVKYKLRRAWHYYAMNHMSDLTEAELARMRNKRLAAAFRERHRPDGPAAHQGEGVPVRRHALELPEFIADEAEDVEAELVELARKHSNELGFAELRAGAALAASRRRRRRRDLAAQLELPPRNFTLDQLIKAPHEDPEEPEVRVKIKSRVRSNNPDYQPIALHMASFGLNNQQTEVTFHSIHRTDWRPISDQLAQSLADLSRPEVAAAIVARRASEPVDLTLSPPPPDEVFVDHRKSNCMFKPRDQGNCGACYAFASVTLMEWLYCMKTGKLVPFSEQYIVDCGNGRYDEKMFGCEGAEVEAVADFWSNFGLELRVNYPYRGRNQTCPYGEDFDLKKTGYVRMDYQDASFVHQRTWESHLAHAPIYVGHKSYKDFAHYGGGIDDGEQCSDVPDHAMLLVGHGREDGLEYWILRNSYSTKWGEGGYYRLAKRATSECLDTNGLMLGTQDGKNFNFEALHTGLGQAKKQESYITSMYNFITRASRFDKDTVLSV